MVSNASHVAFAHGYVFGISLMKVVLAEKPSVARDIAKHLVATKRCDGWLEGNGWIVTWAFGHLVELQEPEDYTPEWKSWRRASLPIFPERFGLRPRSDARSLEQLNTIKRLFESADEIICATDAGREGELIFRYILSWSCCEQKPIRRLWISSLTNEAIEKGFENLAPGNQYDRLYQAARCRSEADWLVGINATRFYTLEYGKRQLLLSLGRVQTPVLAMIVNRDLAIENFKSEEFWEVHTISEGALFKHTKGKFIAKAEAESVVTRILGKELIIQSVSKKNALTNPPQLFDLTSLQREMNKLHGLTAEQTLKIAQDLYERKHLTYPRTDSCYLSTDIVPGIAPLLEKLRSIKPTEIARLDLSSLPFNKRIVDDAKVSDHHAIIPTNVPGDTLKGDEAKVYDAVLTRLIAVFYPPCIKAVTTVEAVISDEPFRARGTVLVDAGWQVLYGGVAEESSEAGPPKETSPKEGTDKEEDSRQVLPDFIEGSRHLHAPKIPQFKTSAPKRFTEASLLQLMETAGNQVTDETLKEALKEKGVGTPATRAAIIEVLIARGYVERKKKNLLSTLAGRALISIVRNEKLKSPELTGDWEYRLKRIEKGEYDPDVFMSEIRTYTREILNGTAEQTIDLSNLGPCPLCGAAVMRGRTGYGCTRWREGCGFVLAGSLWGMVLSPVLAREILIHKRSLTPRPLEVDGKKLFALIRIGKKGEVEYEAATVEPASGDPNAIGTCPVCGGEVVEGKKGYGCTNWRNGCSFIIWKTIARREISKETAIGLLKDKTTAPMDGFLSKAGKPFTAKLKIVDGAVKLDFSA